jgi:hypothetical protein
VAGGGAAVAAGAGVGAGAVGVAGPRPAVGVPAGGATAQAARTVAIPVSPVDSSERRDIISYLLKMRHYLIKPNPVNR